MAIEIVDLPIENHIENGDAFHLYVSLPEGRYNIKPLFQLSELS